MEFEASTSMEVAPTDVWVNYKWCCRNILGSDGSFGV
jgi:hypothetical protein